ncbi:dual specificity protein phosphatase 7-like [Uloborus diversus]|uniref:dual specificity protein phosphatase 7-like n=1 Tax=Uloborus diversus TaxID=327109 RepID=UPI0024098995|nr:dual specificity protein phosphatase 7-like [Uloborus diversus]
MYITPEKLYDDVKSPDGRSLIIDCRSASDYHDGHVKGAINFTIPASVIMLRRLANGKMSIPSIIRGTGQREKFIEQCKTHTIVLYDYNTEEMKPTGPCVLSTLFRRLRQDGCQVVCLQGGFNAFKSLMPEWIESDSPEVRNNDLSLENLRITPLSDHDSDAEHCDSGLDGEPSPNDPPFPVEILPYLFLGNAENSADLEALQRHKIRYILNVTPNLPNAFEDKGLGFKYMKIPIQDHWSQNLATYFPEAIAFIDEARQKKECILVHCLAGISRSVTITLAYLMQKLSMPLNDAYDFVRQRKANISPNFNFMGQLMDYERQLSIGPCHCTCQASPCHCQTLHFISPTRITPDSGIDVDHWT